MQKANVMRFLSLIKLLSRLSYSETRSSQCRAAASRLGTLCLLAMLPTLSSGGPVSANGENELLAAPAAPKVTAVSATSLSVAWTAPANLRSPVSDYDVRYRLVHSSGGFRYADHTGTGTTVTLYGLRPDKAYKVQVRAHNDAGPSAWSALGIGRTYENAIPVFTDEGDGFESLKLDVSGSETTGADLPIETSGQADVDENIYSLMGRNAGEFIIDADSSVTFTAADNAAGVVVDPARTTPLSVALLATEPVALAVADANQTSQLALAAVGRSVAEDVIEALNARMVAARSPESFFTINGQRTVVGRAESEGTSRSARTAEQHHLLDNSEFQLAIDETNELTLWGRRALGHFNSRSGAAAALALDGQLDFGYLGVDYRRAGAATGVGLLLLHNQGTLDYQGNVIAKDNATLTLTNVLPYVHWQPKAGVDVWSLVGYGVGAMEVLDVDPVRLRMGAVGLRYDLRTLGRVQLAAKTDAFAMQLTPDTGAGSTAQRLRLALESRMNWRVSPDGSLQPTVELGVRWDGGDGSTGPGAEVAGGLTYTDERYGLHVEARGRRLLAHREGHVGLWGGSLMVRRQSADRRGLQVALGPSWGKANSQVESLWRGQLMAGPADAEPSWTPSELTLTSGYGLNLSASSQLTPFVEAGTGPMQRLRVGTRWDWMGAGMRQVEIFGEQRRGPGTPADRSIQLRGTLEL